MRRRRGRIVKHTEAQAWLDRYIAAWRTSDPDQIWDLFADDVEYRYHPFDEPIEGGREGVVASWLEEPDPADTWEATYSVWSVDGNRVVATGHSHYFATDTEPDKRYHNCFLMEFDDEGRCSLFTEFYIRE
jgi:ketosteroid isomerase-like protein